MAVDGFLNFDTKINTKGFQKGTKSLSNSLSGLNSKLNGIAKAAAAVFSIKQIAAFTKSCKEAYQVQFEAEARLEQVMRNTMGATNDQIKSIKTFASELQNVGVIGDEVTLSGLQELGTYVENADSLKTMSVVLGDMLAQQYGLNATAENAVTISTMLGKVLEGQTSALSRYGYKFDEAQEQLLKYGTEEQRVATLAEVVEASVGGMNEALARTPAGRLKQISNNMGDVKEQFGKAVTNIQALFLPALERLAATLARVADMAVRVSEALANVFGISLDSSSAVTGSIYGSVDAQDALTEAVEETNKAQKNSLASFDKINTLATQTAEESTVSGSGVLMPVTMDETPVEKQISELEKKIQKLIEPLKIAWDNKGEDLMKAVSNRWDALKGLFSSITGSFKEAWNKDGVGQSILEHLLGIYTQYNIAYANLFDAIKRGWEENGAGVRIFSAVLNFAKAISGILERAFKVTADWFKNLNLTPFFDAIAGLLEVLEPIGEKIGEGLLWCYENVLLPIAGWIIEDAVPASIDALSAAIQFCDEVITAFKPMGEWLWNKFLKPLGKGAGNATVKGLKKIAKGYEALTEAVQMRSDIWDVIKEKGNLGTFFRGWGAELMHDWGLDSVGDFLENNEGFFYLMDYSPLFDKWNEFFQGIGEKLFDFKEEWVSFWEGVGGKVEEFQETLLGVWNGITGWFSEKWESIKDVFSNVGDFFKETFIGAKDNVTGAWEGVSGWFSDIWENIKSAFSNVGTWFKERFSAAKENITNIWSKVGNWFGERWTDIKNVFANVGSWFKERFEAARNNVKGAFEKIGNWFGDRWNDIKDVFKGVGLWFKERFQAAYNNVVGVFEGIGGFFSGLWNDITNGLTEGINWAIDKINGLLTRLESGINDVTSAISSAMSIHIPDDVPVFGGTDFDLNLPSVNIPEIPRLAQGTVIPANYGNFLSILGDNKRETEVVSPLSTIKEALVEALAGVGYGNQPIHVHVDLDGREIGRVAVKAVNSDNARRGR